MAKDVLPKEHHLQGYCFPASTPVLFFRFPDKAAPSALAPFANPDLGRNKLAFLPYGSDQIFGSPFTVTAFHNLKGIPPLRVCLFADDPGFRLIERGRFLAVFMHRMNAICAYKLDLCSHTEMAENFQTSWQRARSHVCLLPDRSAAYWENLLNLTIFDAHFTRRDQLSLGWADRHLSALAWFVKSLSEARARAAFPADDTSSLPASLQQFIRLISNTETGINLLLDYLESVRSSGPREILNLLMMEKDYVSHCHRTTGHNYCWTYRELFSIYMDQSHLTDCGSHVSWIDLDGKLKSTTIELNRFKNNLSPRSFWERLPQGLRYCWGEIATGADYPLCLSDASHWAGIRFGGSTSDIVSSADALLEEAFASRKWTIPPRAYVQLTFGPFAGIEIVERLPHVFAKWMCESGECIICSIEPDNQLFSIFGEERLDKLSKQIDVVSLKATLKLLLSAIIRDFWVLEERTTTSQRIASPSTSGGPRLSKVDDSPRIVYLPRVKYISKPRIVECSEQLGLAKRRAHFVTAHLRKAGNPAEHQLMLARRYGVDVPVGFTFVRPHERGTAKKTVLYRSRSALRTLFEEETSRVNCPFSGYPDWFRFEKDVYDLMNGLGFCVEHVSVSTGGDGGIDIYATKGTDLEQVNWIVQCKCWRKSVGPAVVRELIGSLQNEPHGTRGLIVTTSHFSSGAVELASQEDIRLMDGAEFAKLLSAQTGG